MWQRAQTLYLAISTILTIILFFSYEAIATNADGDVLEAIKFTDSIAQLILLIVILLLSILAISTPRFLVFQFRTTALLTIVTLALQAWIAKDYFSIGQEIFIFRLKAVFPLVCVILDVLAARGILADQMLVESASSLRKSRRERRAARK